jgi:hypothetical protein
MPNESAETNRTKAQGSRRLEKALNSGFLALSPVPCATMHFFRPFLLHRPLMAEIFF